MKKSQVKKGFTLIEVILAIVVVAVIMGIVIPKVMNNADRATLKQVIAGDVRSIVAAAADWKRTDRVNANGTYANISAKLLDSRLPTSNAVDTTGTNNFIKSSKFNGGCEYRLQSSTITVAGDSFTIAMDCTNAANLVQWDDKLKAYAEESFIDTVKGISLGGASTVELTTGDIGDGTDDTTCTTTTKNGIICVTKIVQ